MNRYKCPACGGNQYTSADTAEGCIYCGHKELKKMEILEPKEGEGMREIKFRGKRLDNGEWVKGYYFKSDEKHFIKSAPGVFGQYQVIPETVGQFTGFITAMGQEVYEDDIVKDGNGNIYRVKRWGGTGNQPNGFGAFESFMCCTKEKDGKWLNHTKPLRFQGMEVIGNIHDNSSLLEVPNA
jgi:uncharacterized phage protein (TIGR01671 family)